MEEATSYVKLNMDDSSVRSMVTSIIVTACCFLPSRESPLEVELEAYREGVAL